MTNKSIVVNIANSCNNNCIMCTNDRSQQSKLANPTWTDVLRQLGDRNYTHITLTGGEPTCNPRFFEIIKKVRDTNPKASLLLLTWQPSDAHPRSPRTLTISGSIFQPELEGKDGGIGVSCACSSR